MKKYLLIGISVLIVVFLVGCKVTYKNEIVEDLYTAEDQSMVDEISEEEFEDLERPPVNSKNEIVVFQSYRGYELHIPILEGYKYQSYNVDSEFLLEEIDGSGIFYIESDYSPTIMVEPIEIFKFNSNRNQNYTVQQYVFEEGSGLMYAENDQDPAMSFSFRYGSEMKDPKEVLKSFLNDFWFKEKFIPKESIIDLKSFSQNPNYTTIVDTEKYTYEILDDAKFRKAYSSYFTDEEKLADFKLNFHVGGYIKIVSIDIPNVGIRKYKIGQACAPSSCGNTRGTFISSIEENNRDFAIVITNEGDMLYEFNALINNKELHILGSVHEFGMSILDK